uniref:Uncharacterized protein n=1 Tax=Knipowitschia caucasica TaxID=637954 RepID=A0AAV2LV57_KNICA
MALTGNRVEEFCAAKLDGNETCFQSQSPAPVSSPSLQPQSQPQSPAPVPSPSLQPQSPAAVSSRCLQL